MITASQLRAARSYLNLDQQVVAEAVGVSKANISDIENEKATPKASTLDGIQKFFEMHGIEFRHGGIIPANKVIQIFYQRPANVTRRDSQIAAGVIQGGVEDPRHAENR